LVVGAVELGLFGPAHAEVVAAEQLGRRNFAGVVRKRRIAAQVAAFPVFPEDTQRHGVDDLLQQVTRTGERILCFLQRQCVGMTLGNVAADHDEVRPGLVTGLQGSGGEFEPVFPLRQGQPVGLAIGKAVLHRPVDGALTGLGGIGRQYIGKPFTQ